MTINSTASTLLSLYISVAELQGFSPGKLRGTTQNDILKEYIARNTYIYPPKPSIRLIGDTIEHCYKHVPQWLPISISGYHMREAGCTAVQELAFTFANAIEYISTCVDRGIKIDDFAQRLSFFFCCTMEFFEEVAKFRAAREIYAKIMKDIFHAKNAKSLHLRFHVQTSGESLTAQQVDNNIVRVTTQALARCTRWMSIIAYKLSRRSPCSANRRICESGTSDATDYRGRDGRNENSRSGWRVLLYRIPDPDNQGGS